MLKNFTLIDILNTRTDSVVNVKGNTLKFNVQTAEDLDFPQFVQFLINTKEKQFAIRPCGMKDEMAIPFCNGRERKRVVVNQAIVAGLIRKMAGWSMEDTWDMPGVYDADDKALAYSVAAAVQPEPRNTVRRGGRRKKAEAKSLSEE